MDYEKLYKESMRRTAVFVKRGSMTADFAKAIFDDFEMENEDERIRKALIKLVKKTGEGYENVIDGVSIENAISWLEKQGEQKPAEWNEGDKYYYNIIMYLLYNETVGAEDKINALSWFESLKDRVQPQPKQEWSEGDEKMFEECYLAISGSEMHTLDEKEEMEIWLKSLRPQNHWMPSEDQIKVLQELCKYSEVANLTEKGVEILKSMYNDIKKLREE